MKKDILRSIAAVAIVLVLYILIAFLIPFEHTPVFWASFVFTLAAFAVVVASFYIAFGKPEAKSRFYGFPIAKIGAIYGAVQLVVGVIFMAAGEHIATWLAVLIYAVGMGAALLGLIAADAVSNEIKVQEDKQQRDTSLMRSLQFNVSQLAAQTNDPALKALAEEFRYSDPVSHEALTAIEGDLYAAVGQLSSAVANGDSEATQQLCSRVSVLLDGRNRMSKMYKK